MYWVLSQRYYLIDPAAGVQAYLYAAFVGGSAAFVYWLVAHQRLAHDS